MENRKITEFPKPYLINATPYGQQSFSKETIMAIKKKIPLIMNISKTIVVGDVSAGKTAIVQKFSFDHFEANYKATIGVDFEIENFRILEIPFSLQIWDTAGQERFKCIAKTYYRNTNVVVIVFDMTKEESLNTVPCWLQSAMSVNLHKPFVFLVGSKCDLLSKVELSNIEQNAVEVAQMIGAEYWSVSAKTGYCIKGLFHRIVALSFDNAFQQYAYEFSQAHRHHVSSTIFKLKSIINEEPRRRKSNCQC